MSDEFKTLQKFDAGNGREGFSSFASGARSTGNRADLATAGQHSHRARIGPAKLRRQKGSAQRCRDAGELEREVAGERRDSVRRRAHRPAGFHRRSAGGRSRGDAQRGEATRRRSENHRTARAGRSGGRSLRAGRFRRLGRGVAVEHGDGVQAQPRALPISEMGPAGVQDFRARSARHRHRAPGESRISRERRALRQTVRSRSTLNFSTPTRSSAPIRTRP